MKKIQVETVEGHLGRLLREKESCSIRVTNELLAHVDFARSNLAQLERKIRNVYEPRLASPEKEVALREESNLLVFATLVMAHRLGSWFGIDGDFLEKLKREKPNLAPLVNELAGALK
jgi:hypothetical protein